MRQATTLPALIPLPAPWRKFEPALPAGSEVGGEAAGEAVAVRQRKKMAKLLKPPEEAKKAITAEF